MIAIILAAGYGKRMLPLTNDLPKPLVKLGKYPLIYYVVKNFQKAGFKDFVVIIGYLGSKIKDYFKENNNFDLNIDFIEQKKINGTGTAVLMVENYVNNENFMLTYSDIICDYKIYQDMLSQFEYYYNYLLAINYVEDPYAGAAISLFPKEEKILKIVEKPPQGSSNTHWNNAGIYIFSPSIFDYIRKTPKSIRNEIEITSTFQILINEGETINYYQIPISYLYLTVENLNEIKKFNKNKTLLKQLL